MYQNMQHNVNIKIGKAVLAVLFGLSTVLWSAPVTAQGTTVTPLPAPGTIVQLSPAFEPVIIKGMTIYPNDPLRFDFIVHRGDSTIMEEEVKRKSKKLIKYFLASLTVPKDDLWVNLSPHERGRIIPEYLSKTDLGRDLLEQDYILKQLSASLMYPETELGQKFWNRVRAKAFKEFGTTQLPVKTFHKVWILPESATIFENDNTVYILETKLKIMLDDDYQALQFEKKRMTENLFIFDTKPKLDAQERLQANIIKEIILQSLDHGQL